MKSQALILQFVLFFIIGVFVFTTFTNFFSSFGLLSSNDIRSEYARYVLSYFENGVYFSYLNCRHCNNFTFRIVEGIKPGISKRPDFSILSSNGLLTVFASPRIFSVSNLANLNESIKIGEGGATSVLPIVISYQQNNNILEIKNGV